MAQRREFSTVAATVKNQAKPGSYPPTYPPPHLLLPSHWLRRSVGGSWSLPGGLYSGLPPGVVQSGLPPASVKIQPPEAAATPTELTTKQPPGLKSSKP